MTETMAQFLLKPRQAARGFFCLNGAARLNRSGREYCGRTKSCWPQWHAPDLPVLPEPRYDSEKEKTDD